MAQPANSGWSGGKTPLVMTHEDGHYRVAALAKISSTSFDFETNQTEHWTITNLHDGPITYTFYADSQGAHDSCRVKPASGRLDAGSTLSGIVEAKAAVDTSRQWDMTLKFWDEQKPSQEMSIAINRSQRDKIRKKSRTAHLSSEQPAASPSTKHNGEPSTQSHPTIGTPPTTQKSAPVPDKSQDRTVDFTFIVMFAITLAIVIGINAIITIPLPIYTAIIAAISFVSGAATYAYTGPFKEWVNSFASKSSKSKRE